MPHSLTAERNIGQIKMLRIGIKSREVNYYRRLVLSFEFDDGAAVYSIFTSVSYNGCLWNQRNCLYYFFIHWHIWIYDYCKLTVTLCRWMGYCKPYL